MKKNSILYGIMAIALLTITTPFLLPNGIVDSQNISKAISAPTDTLFSYQGELLDSNDDPVTGSVDMTFAFFNTSSGGSACWSENHTAGNAVNVQDGHFHVLLGEYTAVDKNCLVGDVYLELTVNSEPLSPREILTSSFTTIEAHTIEADAITRGNLNVNGNLVVSQEATPGNGGWIDIVNETSENYWRIPIKANDNDTLYFNFKNLNSPNDSITVLELLPNGNVKIKEGDGTLHVRTISGDGETNRAQIHMPPDGNEGHVIINSGTGKDLIFRGGTTTDQFRAYANGDVSLVGDLSLNGINTPFKILTDRPWQFEQSGTGSSTNLDLRSNSNVKLFRFVNENGTPIASFFADNSSGGRLDMNGHDIQNVRNLQITGSCTVGTANNLSSDNDLLFASGECESGQIVSGAYVEANLMTREQLVNGSIDHFEKGDLLCWSAKLQQLALCTQPNNRLVQAVADSSGKPIILGAEPIKVVGPVTAGDILVSSDFAGHAMVNNNPLPGTVIGQALQDFDGSTGLIKAMIRKW